MYKRWFSTRFTQVPALIAVHFFVGFVFWYGIEKLFLKGVLNVGPTGISAIVILYMVMTLVLDVPASVIADRWGRKRMLLFSILFFIASNTVLGSATSFNMYLIGTALWGLFTVSFYGTFEAILFDSLKAQKREASFQKVDAVSRFFFMIGIATASVVSGFIANRFGLRDVYFFSIIPLVGALVALSFTKEPSAHTDGDDIEAVQKHGYFAHLAHAFRLVWQTPKLRLVMFGVIIMFFIQTPMYEFNQYIYIVLFKSPVLVGLFGGVIGGLPLAAGFLLALRIKVPPTILLFVSGISIGIFALLSNNASLIFVALALGSGAMLENALQTQLQHATTSRTRAAVTSASYFPGNVLIVPFVYIFGAIAQGQSIWTAYIVDGIVVVVMCLVYVVISRGKWNRPLATSGSSLYTEN